MYLFILNKGRISYFVLSGIGVNPLESGLWIRIGYMKGLSQIPACLDLIDRQVSIEITEYITEAYLKMIINICHSKKYVQY